MTKRRPLKIRLKQGSKYLPGLVGFALIILAASWLGSSHSATQGSRDDSYTKSLTMKWLAQCYTQKCVNQGIENITKNAGPEAALASLNYYDHGENGGSNAYLGNGKAPLRRASHLSNNHKLFTQF